MLPLFEEEPDSDGKPSPLLCIHNASARSWTQNIVTHRDLIRHETSSSSRSVPIMYESAVTLPSSPRLFHDSAPNRFASHSLLGVNSFMSICFQSANHSPTRLQNIRSSFLMARLFHLVGCDQQRFLEI